MPTPIKAELAAERLNTYLDQCGVMEPFDRYIGLRRELAFVWLRDLAAAELAEGLDVWDVIAGIDLLVGRLIMEMPTGSGKSHVGVLSIERPTPALALLEVEP